MNVKRSELQQILFAVVDAHINLEDFESVHEPVDDLDVDLNIFTNQEDDHLIRILFRIQAKKITPGSGGINIDVSAACDFRIDPSLDPSSQDVFNLVNYSATGITYNNIRTYLQNETSYFPVEQYILPTIDLNDLCRQLYRPKETEPPASTK